MEFASTAQLKQLGLNNSEIIVYLDLLKNGLSTPPLVSRRTKIARTNCYNILQELSMKELIAEQKTGARKAYLAKDPESLLRGIEKKKDILAQILPDLRGIFKMQKNKPLVRFFDGLEQIKQVYLETLGSKTVLAFSSIKRFLDAYPEFSVVYGDQLMKREIEFHDVLARASQDRAAMEFKKQAGPLYEFRFLDQQYEEPTTDILVWEDNLAIVTLGESAFATVLTSTALATTFRTMHSVMWSSGST
jgi:sugar-specific transcriptional regulator TrmB